MNEMDLTRNPGQGARNRARSSLLQGYPDENEESPLPQFPGVWKTAIIR